MTKDTQKIIITKIFDATVEKVWKAWTEPELVKKWWGPEGFTAPSIKIDFQVGGKYIYCMHGPKGSPWDKDLYTAGIFKEIVPMEKIVVTDYFSDKEGNKASPTEHGLSSDMPVEMNATIRFEYLGKNKTKLSIEYTRPENEAQFEAMLKSGMEEGWNTSLDKLAETLSS